MVCVRLCVTHGVLCFNIMAKPMAVRNPITKKKKNPNRGARAGELDGCITHQVHTSYVKGFDLSLFVSPVMVLAIDLFLDFCETHL
jgi:hypothetical protein